MRLISQQSPIPCIPRPTPIPIEDGGVRWAADCQTPEPGTCSPEQWRSMANVEASLKALKETDFSMLRKKLMLPEPEGKGWTLEQAIEAEVWYRRFLIICLKYPETKAVPNSPIDQFWHTHILDTRKYAEDCNRIFGHFVHHYPYFGLNGDESERDNSFEETDALYVFEFGESCKGMAEFGTPHEARGCGHKGSGTGCGQGCRR